MTAEPVPSGADPFIERLEAHLREHADARARPRRHAAAKAARAALKLVLFALVALAAAAAGFFAAEWKDVQRSREADALGRQFLANRNLDMSAFLGPVVRAGPHAKTMYTWVSVSPGRNLRLDVSPGSNLVCLYRILSVDKLTPVDCVDKP